MAWRQFTLNDGKGTVSFGLPEERVLGEVFGPPCPAVDVETA